MFTSKVTTLKIYLSSYAKKKMVKWCVVAKFTKNMDWHIHTCLT
jgi:hypothetical protein